MSYLIAACRAVLAVHCIIIPSSKKLLIAYMRSIQTSHGTPGPAPTHRVNWSIRMMPAKQVAGDSSIQES